MLPDLMKLDEPRAVWLAVPASAVNNTIADLRPHLEPADILTVGGPSYYVDVIRRGRRAEGTH